MSKIRSVQRILGLLGLVLLLGLVGGCGQLSGTALQQKGTETVDTSKSFTCTILIECSTLLKHLPDLTEGKRSLVPKDGIILERREVTAYEGESVFDVLQRVCREEKIHMEASFTPIYNSAYVEGIHNLYEFDCGSLSGWTYQVNGWGPNYGCSRYQLAAGDAIEWRYTCDLGADVGCEWLGE